MFSQLDANNLRESLPDMDFQGPAAPDSELLTRYLSHYGLNFDGQALCHRLGRFSIPAAPNADEPDARYDIVCQHFQLPPEQEQGTVFLLHGYFDHAGLFIHLIRHCLSLNLSVVIYDQPGHGLSSGKIASIDSFQRYTQILIHCLELAHRQGLTGPWYLMGQSTGCAVIMEALQQQSSDLLSRIERFVLLAPLLRPHRWAQLQYLFYFLRFLVSKVPRGFPANSHDQDFLDFLANHDELQSRIIAVDWLQAMHDYQKRFITMPSMETPLHIIQGSDDTTVDWKYNLQKIAQQFPRAKTYMVANARHHMVNESLEYRERIFGLISEIVQAANNE